MARNWIQGGCLAAAAVLALAIWPERAQAYPWMIRHDYTGCAVCHVDPSGSGLLTQYGRAQGELVLRTQYTSTPPGQEREPGSVANFAWGAFDWAHIPDWLLLGGSFRGAYLGTKIPDRDWDVRYIQMQADLYAGLSLGHVRASGSLGVLPSGGKPAVITNIGSWVLVSRQHWIGYAFGDDDAFLIRAGRINLPFGLRNIEHTSFVRFATRTDINSFQQHGVAFSYTGEKWRGELMAILGNFQIDPQHREYGYSGLAELSFTKNAAMGVSSLITYAKKDLVLQPGGPSNLRQAHGLFARYAPVRPLVLLAETDLVVNNPSGTSAYVGYAGFLQADVEFIQGLHVFVTPEIFREDFNGASPSWTLTLTPNWFFAPHTDIRLDLFLQKSVRLASSTTGIGFLAMLHFYL